MLPVGFEKSREYAQAIEKARRCQTPISFVIGGIALALILRSGEATLSSRCIKETVAIGVAILWVDQCSVHPLFKTELIKGGAYTTIAILAYAIALKHLSKVFSKESPLSWKVVSSVSLITVALKIGALYLAYRLSEKSFKPPETNEELEELNKNKILVNFQYCARVFEYFIHHPDLWNQMEKSSQKQFLKVFNEKIESVKEGYSESYLSGLTVKK